MPSSRNLPRWTLCGLIAVVAAAAGVGGEQVRAQDWHPIQDSNVDAQGLANSATVPVSRELTNRCTALQTKLQGSPGLAEFEQILEIVRAPDEELVAAGDLIVHPAHLAAEWLANMPAETRQAFAAYAKPRLEAELQRNIERSDVAAISTFAFRFRELPAGQTALRWLVAYGLDRGRPGLVQHAAERLAATRGASPADIDHVRWQQFLAMREFSSEIQADAFYQRHQAAIERAVRAANFDLNPPETTPDAVREDGRRGASRLSAVPEWAEPTFAEPISSEYVHRLARLGVSSFPAVAARETDDGLLIVRGADGVAAWELSKRQLRWHRESDSNIVSAGPFPDDAVRRRERETISSALSVDAHRAYVLNWESQRWFLQRTTDAEKAPPLPPARLVAVDLETGETSWETSGKDSPLGEVFFRCAPVVTANRLLLLAETSDGALHLAKLNAQSGAWLSSKLLTNTPRRLADDPLRAHAAAALSLEQGRLLCVTGSGLSLAIDPISLSIEWAARYRLRGRLHRSDDDRQKPTNRVQQWWRGVPATQAATAGSHVLIATPESEPLLLVDPRSFVVRPLSPPDNVLQVAPTPITSADGKDAFLIVGADRVQCIRSSGEPLWTNEIPRPAGRGVILEKEFVLPTADGKLAFVALDGSGVRVSNNPPSVPLGHLIATRFGWISVRPEQLAWLGKAASPGRENPALAVKHGLSVKTRINRAIEAGEIDRALAIFREALNTPDTVSADTDTHDKGTENPDPSGAIWKSLAMAAVRAEPERWRAIWDHEQTRRLSDADRWQVRLSCVQGAIAAGDARAAVDSLVELNQPGADECCMVDGGGRRVRGDLAVQAALEDLLAGDDAMAEAARERWQQICQTFAEGGDRFTAAEFVQAFRYLDEIQRLIARHDRDLGPGEDLREAELELQAIRQVADGFLAAMAATRWRQLAEQHWTGLTEEAPKWPTCPAPTEGIADPETADGAEASVPGSDEAAECPRVTVGPSEKDDVYFTLVPVKSVAGSLFSRLDVAVSRQFDVIRLFGDNQSGTWDVVLPRASNAHRYVYDHVQGWGIGHLLIVRLGTDLIAIAPYDELRQPRAEVMWKVDLLPDDTNLSTHRAVRIRDRSMPGFEFDALYDAFGYPLGQVFAVTPAAIVYRRAAELVAVEPWTGREMWNITDVPADAYACVRGGELAIVDPADHRVALRRLFDGRLISSHELKANWSDVLAVSDDRILYRAADEALLRCHSLVEHRTLWQRTFQKRLALGPLDESRLVMADGDSVDVVAWDSGADLWSRPVDAGNRAPIDRVAGFADAALWYIFTSAKVDAGGSWSAAQVRGALRSFPINGQLTAVSRAKRHTAWEQPLDDMQVTRNQPKAVGLLAMMYRPPLGDANPATVPGKVVILDKHSGRILVRRDERPFALYHSWELRPELGRVNLHLPLTTIRFDYRPAPQPDAEPERSDDS